MTDQNQQPETEDTGDQEGPYLQNEHLKKILNDSRQGIKEIEDFHGHTPFVPPKNEDGTYTLTHEQLAELINLTHVRAIVYQARAVNSTIEQMAEEENAAPERILSGISWLAASTANENIDHMNACLADNPFSLPE